jgi:hypothetical protein
MISWVERIANPLYFFFDWMDFSFFAKKMACRFALSKIATYFFDGPLSHFPQRSWIGRLRPSSIKANPS